MLTRRIVAVLLGALFLLALVLNGYLLVSAVDGAHIVQQVESAAGRGLSCMELYQARAINAYFDVQRPQQGNALYLMSLAWPIWVVLSIGIAFGWTSVIDGQKRWRWLPVFSMSLVVLLLILFLPTIAKVSCAID